MLIDSDSNEIVISGQIQTASMQQVLTRRVEAPGPPNQVPNTRHDLGHS